MCDSVETLKLPRKKVLSVQFAVVIRSRDIFHYLKLSANRYDTL
jgi:hypothetical protein